MARFETDRQSLCQDFMETGEVWEAVQVIEMRRLEQKRKCKNVWRLMTKAQMLAHYNQDTEFVDHLIKAKIEQGAGVP